MSRISRSLRVNPFWVFSRYHFREAHLRAYIIREHRRGRPLAEIISSPYASRLGSREWARRVLQHPLTIAALERNDLEAIAGCSEELRDPGREPAAGGDPSAAGPDVV